MGQAQSRYYRLGKLGEDFDRGIEGLNRHIARLETNLEAAGSAEEANSRDSELEGFRRICRVFKGLFEETRKTCNTTRNAALKEELLGHMELITKNLQLLPKLDLLPALNQVALITLPRVAVGGAGGAVLGLGAALLLRQLGIEALTVAEGALRGGAAGATAGAVVAMFSIYKFATDRKRLQEAVRDRTALQREVAEIVKKLLPTRRTLPARGETCFVCLEAGWATCGRHVVHPPDNSPQYLLCDRHVVHVKCWREMAEAGYGLECPMGCL